MRITRRFHRQLNCVPPGPGPTHSLAAVSRPPVVPRVFQLELARDRFIQIDLRTALHLVARQRQMKRARRPVDLSERVWRDEHSMRPLPEAAGIDYEITNRPAL